MIVTFLTDFGTADYFVAAMKGVILSRAPAATLVDVTHEVAAQSVEEAAFTLGAAYPLFPPGTVHLVVVDPGVGSSRRALVVEAGGHRFVAPDNGVLGPAFDHPAGWRAFHAVDDSRFRHPVSSTFHGRDVFAPLAAALAAGAAPADVGVEITDPVRLPRLAVERLAQGAVRGAVLHVDRFGNCVTNLSRGDLPDGPLRLEVAGREIRALRRYYAEAAEGELFAIWGSADLLELVVNRGSAAALLGAARGTPVLARPAPATA